MNRSLVAFPLVSLLIAGCATPDWRRDFEPTSNLTYAPVTHEHVRLEQADFDELMRSQQTDGFVVLGKAEFRRPTYAERPGTRGSSLRDFAAEIGADYVRWAERLVDVRERYFRGQGCSSTASDYVGVFYREAPAEFSGADVAADEQSAKASSPSTRD